MDVRDVRAGVGRRVRRVRRRGPGRLEKCIVDV